MKLSNDMHLLIESMGKLFLITHICRTEKEANQIMSENEELSCISVDEDGRVYLAKENCVIDLNKVNKILDIFY